MSEKFEIIFLPEAVSELENIYKYISENSFSEKTANKVIIDIDKAISYIKTFPYMYPMSVFDGYRKCIVKNYVVFYRVDEIAKEAIIVHVFHGAQDIENLF